VAIERETKGNRKGSGRTYRVALLLGLVGALTASALGSTLGQSFLTQADVAYAPATRAAATADLAMAPSAPSAEPLLLLLLGSMLLCIAYAISIYVSRTEAK
jgi:hypothetical protein